MLQVTPLQAADPLVLAAARHLATKAALAQAHQQVSTPSVIVSACCTTGNAISAFTRASLACVCNHVATEHAFQGMSKHHCELSHVTSRLYTFR